MIVAGGVVGSVEQVSVDDVDVVLHERMVCYDVALELYFVTTLFFYVLIDEAVLQRWVKVLAKSFISF